MSWTAFSFEGATDEVQKAEEPHLPEFASAWHQEAFVEALKRELAGYQRRQDELKALRVREDEPAYRDALAGEAAVKAELRRLSASTTTKEKA